MKITLQLLALCLLFAGCGRIQPQRPIRHNTGGTEADSTLIGLISLNQRLSEEADAELTRHADNTYVLEDNGCWIKGLHDIDDGFTEGTRVTVNIVLHNMGDTLLLNLSETAVIGKYQPFPAMADLLQQMHPKDTVRMLIPWYMGFGTTGNQYIPPYTNLKATITAE